MASIYVDPENQINWDNFFSQKRGQTGHGAFFEGQMYQRGHGLGNIFRGLFKMLAPVAKTFGRQALESGLHLAADTLEGKSLKESAVKRGRQAGKKMVNEAQRRLKHQRGKGIKRGRKNSVRKTKRVKLGVPKDIFGQK